MFISINNKYLQHCSGVFKVKVFEKYYKFDLLSIINELLLKLRSSLFTNDFQLIAYCFLDL